MKKLGPAAGHGPGQVALRAAEERLRRVLRFFAEQYTEARLVDPANASNIVTADVHWSQKEAVARCAQSALGSEWERAVW